MLTDHLKNMHSLCKGAAEDVTTQRLKAIDAKRGVKASYGGLGGSRPPMGGASAAPQVQAGGAEVIALPKLKQMVDFHRSNKNTSMNRQANNERVLAAMKEPAEAAPQASTQTLQQRVAAIPGKQAAPQAAPAPAPAANNVVSLASKRKV